MNEIMRRDGGKQWMNDVGWMDAVIISCNNNHVKKQEEKDNVKKIEEKNKVIKKRRCFLPPQPSCYFLIFLKREAKWVFSKGGKIRRNEWEIQLWDCFLLFPLSSAAIVLRFYSLRLTFYRARKSHSLYYTLVCLISCSFLFYGIFW